MTHIRIYDTRNKKSRSGHSCNLTLTGEPEDYLPEEAYEARLAIGNAHGDVSVRIVNSVGLPSGATVSVDNVEQEVVVAWPAYAVLSETDPDVVNAGFEAGDVDWIKGAGWIIAPQEENQVFDGTYSAEYSAGFRGNSRLISAQRRKCAPGTTVTASCKIQQGGSSEGNAGGWCMLFFYDSDGNQLQEKKGNKVDSGSDSEWHTSTVTDTAPVGTAYAAIGAEAFRKKQDRGLWFDVFTWNLLPEVDEFIGTNDDGMIILSLEITDSFGCIAVWDYIWNEIFGFVIGGSLDHSYVSETGASGTYTSVPMPGGHNDYIRWMATNGLTVLAIGGQGYFWRSYDGGHSWERIDTFYAGCYCHIVRGPDRWVTSQWIDGLGFRMMVSFDDGDSWSFSPVISSGFWDSLTYGGGLYLVAFGSYYDHGNFTSPDGLVWTNITGTINPEINGAAYHEASGNWYLSTNAGGYFNFAPIAGGVGHAAMCTVPDGFLAADFNGHIYHLDADDGSKTLLWDGFNGDIHFTCIAASKDGQYIVAAAASGGTAVGSTDGGATWQDLHDPGNWSSQPVGIVWAEL